MVLFMGSAMGQITFVVDTTNVDTFTKERSVNQFSIFMTADSGVVVMASYSISSSLNRYSAYAEFRTIDNVVAYGGGTGSFNNQLPLYGFTGVNNITEFRFNGGIYNSCPADTGVVQDTILVNLELGVQNTNSWTTIDSTFKVPMVSVFHHLPQIDYYSNGNLSLTAGDWKYIDTTGGRIPGAWLLVRQGWNDLITPIHLINDTTISNLWYLLDSIGYNDTCVTVSLYTGEEWCLWSEQSVCRPIALASDQALGKMIAYPNPSREGRFTISNVPIGSVVTVKNIAGQVIWLGDGTTPIDLSEKPDGIYSVDVTTPEKSVRFRMFKQ